MDKNRENNIKILKNSKIKFSLSIILIDLIMVIITYFIMPIIQNFPPLSEDFGFQEKVQILTHIEQYTIVFILGVTIHLISFKIIMKKVNAYLKQYYSLKKIIDEDILDIRKECQNIPYKVLIIQILLFISIGIIFNLIMLIQFFTIIKFTLAVIAITSIVSLLTFISTQNYLKKILLSTYDLTIMNKKDIGYRIGNTKSLILQTMPFIAVILVLLSLIGYSKATEKEGIASANYYKVYLKELRNVTNNIEKNDLIKKLNNVPLNNEDDIFFIISPYEREIYTSNSKKTISQFVLDYRDYFYNDFEEGMLYENFGVDEQIYAVRMVDNSENNWYVGYKFSTIDKGLLLYYFVIIITIVFIYTFILYIWAKNITKNTKRISDSLKNILDSNNIEDTNIVPVMANDELGDLAYYYNKIQKKLIAQQKIIELKSTYEGLEDSATNMAHSIKNDSASIDGCIDLLYDDEIRKDDVQCKKVLDNMKLANNEILDLVKGTMSQFLGNHNTEKIYFSLNNMLEDLIKVEENSMDKIGGKINLKIENEIQIYGVENKLYQALSNLIKNARLTYEERKISGDININAFEDEEENINITIEDKAGGIPKEIQKGIFKEMLTTRGAKGTGLGLFFTGMNIQIDFKGQISFKSVENEGTIFFIKIPKKID